MNPEWLMELLARERLPAVYAEQVRAVHAPLAEGLAEAARARPGLVVGICGPQASGKSTMTAVLARLLEERGPRAATLALDDLYLSRSEREALAARVHPLLVTRGPPGTHDVALGGELLDALRRKGPVRMPRFEKALDDRSGDRGVFEGPADVVLFEGWCVGARPQNEAALAEPVNALEREEDGDGRWRRWVNAQLAGPYQRLFGRLDRLVLLAPANFEVVLDWRREQERKLRERLAADGADPARTMSDEAVARFISHYERLTTHILNEAPSRADWLIRLDEARRPTLSRTGPAGPGSGAPAR